MNNKDIFKLKFGLAIVSLIFLLTGSKLLFDQWKSVPWSFWLLIGLLAYFCVYRTFKSLKSKNTEIIFNGFETAGTITFAFVAGLSTIMLLIFYPLTSLLFFGLALITLSVFVGLRFIIFDFDKNRVHGLLEGRNSNLRNMTVYILSDNNEIEIKILERDDIVVLKREKFRRQAWTQIVDNFEKIKTQT